MAELTAYRCDGCGRVDDGRKFISPLPPRDWYSLSGGPHDLGDPNDWHACSAECVASIGVRIALGEDTDLEIPDDLRPAPTEPKMTEKPKPKRPPRRKTA